jgi:Fe-S cluster assembly iron-binding protein IscA
MPQAVEMDTRSKKAKVIIDASGATIMAGMVMDYIKAKGSVSPKVEGRIVAQ